jgi:hypothetical protein
MSTPTNVTVTSSAHAEVLAAAKAWKSPAIDRVVRQAEAGNVSWQFASDLIWGAIGAKAKELREEGSGDG